VQKTVSEEHASVLSRLSSNDTSLIETLLQVQMENIEASGLPPATHALCRLAALIALDGAPASFAWQVAAAKAGGATDQDVVGVLVAVAPTVGMARVVTAAPELAFAMGLTDDEPNQGGY
jgi:alkylhydroperoxidase/carboxymuconolactone decarboxylase family protein YurZ